LSAILKTSNAGILIEPVIPSNVFSASMHLVIENFCRGCSWVTFFFTHLYHPLYHLHNSIGIPLLRTPLWYLCKLVPCSINPFFLSLLGVPPEPYSEYLEPDP
jgi:hypothetical protein